MYTILRHITDKVIQDECCDLILDITSKALSNKDKLRELTRHLNVVSLSMLFLFMNKIIATLIPLAQSRSKSKKQKENKPLAVLKALMSNDHTVLNDAIGELDPFPEDELFAEINKVTKKINT